SGGDGAVVCAPTGNGNGVNGTQASNITVVNGTIRGMGHTGILLLGGTQVPPHKVEKMSVHSNGSTGIAVDNGLVANSVASTNGIHGIGINLGSVIGNYSTNNGGAGLFIGNGGYANNVFTANWFNSNGDSVLGSCVKLG